MRLHSGGGLLRKVATVATYALATCPTICALDVNPDDPGSVKSVASQIAYDLMNMYTGNQTGMTPGLLPPPHYWWQCGAMMGTMIDYWRFTGDASYNPTVTQAMLWQVGDADNYMPDNRTKDMGNDDQAFWGMAAMSAAEYRFPDPPSDQPQWLALAQAVFNSQALRWDTQYCGGGLRWQVYSFNAGYNYKNTISNGAFFNLAARLARYTGNDTYAEWANKAYDWTHRVGLLTDDWRVFDGSDVLKNCSAVSHDQWSYNVAIFLHGSAHMYNYTAAREATGWQANPTAASGHVYGEVSSSVWQGRVGGFLKGTQVFMDPKQTDVMVEVACENNQGPGVCNTDQLSFKTYLARWMADSTALASFITGTVMSKLKASAIAAAEQCSGGANGRLCGFKWPMGKVWDGSQGVGQQMCALSAVQANLIGSVDAPVTAAKGGTSKGDPGAGAQPTGPDPIIFKDITTADKAGAAILTILALLLVLVLPAWMIM